MVIIKIKGWIKNKPKKEKEEKAHKKIKHIKIKPHHMGLPSTPEKEEMNEDDSDKRDAEREITAQTGSPDVGGFLTSLANQAKGPGAAGGQMMQMSEPMENAWSSLMKEERPLALLSHEQLHDRIDEIMNDERMLQNTRSLNFIWKNL